MTKRFVFFSMNDFVNEGGGTIRMQGILNELAKSGQEVIFISNAEKYNGFHPAIKHVSIDHKFSRNDKRRFQFLLGTFSAGLVRFFFSGFFGRLKEVMKSFKEEENIYFFEYLDNSIGYWLKRGSVINGYINDLHGVATLEFKFQADQSREFFKALKFRIKYFVSNLLDKKVCRNANGLIFASREMERYFIEEYPEVAQKKNFILPYYLSTNEGLDIVDEKLKKELEAKFQITENEKIILFAGAFKKTGGVPDLIKAFQKIQTHHNSRLFLIGDGPTFGESKQLVKEFELEDKVVFLGRTKYHELRTYQELANIIVCPDKQNVYSELIIHVKYLDALASGKLVINGSFKSVTEVNVNEFLSVNFLPSNVDSLANALEKCLTNYDVLTEKYKNNREFTTQNLTYASGIEVLTR